jgi:hypothetical protein
MRTAIAFFVASLVVALLVPFALDTTVHSYPPVFLVGTIPIVWLFTGIVAFPIYLRIPVQRRAQLFPLLLAGFLTAFVSFALFRLVLHPDYEEIGSVVLVRHGWFTWAGIWALLLEAARIGVAGLVGGVAFWVAWRLTIVGGVRDAR